MSVVITPPSVSMPSESGVTSRSSTSVTSPVSTPPCTAAPMATTSSGLTPLCGSLPKYSRTSCWTFGIRVEPPTSTTSSILPGIDARVGQRLLHRRHRPLQQVVDQLLELRPGQLRLQMLRPVLIGGDERQVDVRFHRRRQLDLGLLRRFLQPLERHAVLAEVDPVGLLELGHQPLDDAVVEIVAAEVRVAVGRLHLDHALADFEHRDVEGAAAEVVDRDRLVLLLVEAVGQRRRRRLVDDAQHVQPGDLAGVLGRLPLRVVEVRRHGDDRVGDRLAEMVLGRLLQLLQDHRRDFRRRILLAARFDPRVAVGRANDGVGHARRLARRLVVLAAHESLDREDRVFRVGHGLALGHLADQPLAVLGDGHHRRRRARAFLIDDDGGLPAFHDGDHRVGGAEVDSDHFAWHIGNPHRLKVR